MDLTLTAAVVVALRDPLMQLLLLLICHGEYLVVLCIGRVGTALVLQLVLRVVRLPSTHAWPQCVTMEPPLSLSLSLCLADAISVFSPSATLWVFCRSHSVCVALPLWVSVLCFFSLYHYQSITVHVHHISQKIKRHYYSPLCRHQCKRSTHSAGLARV